MSIKNEQDNVTISKNDGSTKILYEFTQKLTIINLDDQSWVNALSVHKALGVEDKFSNWIVNNLMDINAVDGEDFFLVSDKDSIFRLEGEYPVSEDEYFVSMDLAMELAILERNGIGGVVRKYFVQTEKIYTGRN